MKKTNGNTSVSFTGFYFVMTPVIEKLNAWLVTIATAGCVQFNFIFKYYSSKKCKYKKASKLCPRLQTAVMVEVFGMMSFMDTHVFL